MDSRRSDMTARVLPLTDRRVADASVEADGGTRQALVYHLSVAAWQQTGRPMPSYTRATMPAVRFVRESAAGAPSTDSRSD